MSKNAPPAPSREDVVRRFADLVEGRVSRDQVDRWAAQWIGADDPGVDDPAVWTALNRLCGIDLREHNGEYLHDEAQIREWRTEFEVALRVGRP